MALLFKKAPLPFQGQKRNWIKEIISRSEIFNGQTVVDLFGGSGLLSHTVKCCSTAKEVIWNDFDNYEARLKIISETEALRINLSKYQRSMKRADSDTKIQIIKEIDLHLAKYNQADWITISSWLLFSGNYAHSYEDLISRTFYVRVTQNSLDATDYLSGVTRVQKDFRELLEQYQTREDAVYLCDPPYIMTDQQGYSRKNEHFKLKEMLQLLSSLEGKKALLFSSTKSETDDLINLYFDYKNVKRIEYETSSGAGRKYTERLYLLNI